MDKSPRVRFVVLGLFFALFAIGLVLTSFYRATSRVRTLVIPNDILTCDRDEDCGLTNQIACCPCDFGGGQAAVNRRMRPQLKAFLQRACQDRIPCVDVSACREDLRTACKDNLCTVVTPKGS